MVSIYVSRCNAPVFLRIVRTERSRKAVVGLRPAGVPVNGGDLIGLGRADADADLSVLPVISVFGQLSRLALKIHNL